jgi:hypothetical protein
MASFRKWKKEDGPFDLTPVKPRVEFLALFFGDGLA